MNKSADFSTRIGRAYDLHVAGRLAEAEAAYRTLLRERSNSVDVLYLLSSLRPDTPGSLELARRAVVYSGGRGGIGIDEVTLLDHLARCLASTGGDPVEEARVLASALSLVPDVPDRVFRLSEALRRSGEVAAARDALVRYLALCPDDLNARSNLGTLQFQQGELDAAMLTFRELLSRDPAHPEAHNNLGNVLVELEDPERASEHYRAAVTARPDFGEAWINLGQILDVLGHADEALEALRKARDLMPGDLRADSGVRAILERRVPRWHFPMMNDRARNEAYDGAIRRAVERAGVKDALVLDIGAGSGLLSMMAARAGAGQVVACEMVEEVAAVAREIVTRNGLDDRVTIHKMKSTRLTVGRELPRRANVLVTEIFDVGLLGEYALPVLAHARKSLLADDAVIVPRSARLLMMPVDSQEVFERYIVRNENTCGFDLTPFNQFRKNGYDQVPLRRYDYRPICEPLAVFDFDFSEDVPDRVVDLEITSSYAGTIHALVFWFDLALDDEVRFDTSPFAPESCWRQALQILDDPIAVGVGSRLVIRARHTQNIVGFEIPGSQ